MNGQIRIAFASTSLTHIDASFIGARQLVIYEVSARHREFLDVLRFAPPQRPAAEAGTEAQAAAPAAPGKNGGMCMMADPTLGESMDRLGERIEAIAGCSLMFCTLLNDLAAMRVQASGVFPVKVEVRREIDATIDALQAMMNASPRPPLWLRKLMDQAPNDGARQAA